MSSMLHLGKIPSFLPMELFLNSMKGIVVSSYSNALIVASKFPDIKAVSLIYMIKDEKLKKQIFEKLRTDSNGKIIFVDSLEQLQKFVENCK